LLAASSASSTYVKYASSPPPYRLDIISDLKMVLIGSLASSKKCISIEPVSLKLNVDNLNAFVFVEALYTTQVKFS
jgi:hypothetical protein